MHQKVNNLGAQSQALGREIAVQMPYLSRLNPRASVTYIHGNMEFSCFSKTVLNGGKKRL